MAREADSNEFSLSVEKEGPKFRRFRSGSLFFLFPAAVRTAPHTSRALVLCSCSPAASCCLLLLVMARLVPGTWQEHCSRAFSSVDSSPELLERTCMMRSPCGHECARQTHVGAKTCVLHTSGSASAAKCSCPPRSGSSAYGVASQCFCG